MSPRHSSKVGRREAAPDGPGAPGPPSPRAVASLHRRLLGWYAREARDLPWRRTRNPYAIWVSEIMLQQTQVATATPYYRQFLRRFPSVLRLASARRDDVLSAWAGLGYYRRARMLHEAAAAVVREHGGRVPADPGAFARLPGVGRYTVGAVQSIAFGHPLPVLDGNVARVLSRHFGLEIGMRDPAGGRALWGLATALVPMRDPGDWNQALMELGATVCLPRNPRCGACPISRTCVARGEGRVDQLPPATTRRRTERLRRAIALVEWRGKWLVERLTGSLMNGLWEPPGVDLADGEDAGPRLRARLRNLGVRTGLRDSGERVRHTITHRRIEVEVWSGRASAAPGASSGGRLRPAQARATALTALGARLVRMPVAPRRTDSPKRSRKPGRPARGPAVMDGASGCSISRPIGAASKWRPKG